MVTVSEYRRTIFDLVSRLRRSEEVPLAASAGHVLVLAEDVHSPADVPPFDNSQMDGFAVSSEDPAVTGAQAPAAPAQTAGDVRAAADASFGGPALPLMPMVPAGRAPEPLRRRHAAPVMTGSRMPAGADCVIPVEQTADGFERADAVSFTESLGELAQPGRFVRRRGSDTAAGERIARAGERLSPALAGVLASCGLAHAPVWAPLRILVVSTGDEVVAPGAERGEAQIFDANGIAVTGALMAAGARIVATLHVSDDPADLFAQVGRWAAQTDLVVSMGGISQGAREVIRLAAAAEAEGSGGAAAGGMVFDAVGMQPGGPQAHGRLAGLPWIALPGNPVSSLVSIEMFVRPALLAVPPERAPRPVAEARLELAAPQDSPTGKLQVRRAHLRPDATVELISGPSSHLLGAYARADALALIGAETTQIADGDEVIVWSIA
ncbi:molybdopterin molybdenumtransferase MoeA [Brevibacterium sp. 5221]|uniref:Molybdopterin molybdenumtransferase n=1 Tax=Brevibacterium rongguiense TaxID=2695267 RepID=A0A6N9H804_9MICO|nr:gephyrin-like molybdotransferase Glp [Brevibacterium rongguiense]MYM19712.1 molybdopterin molybdenumtransferase MoeA [Brevibacterium rongguiense]